MNPATKNLPSNSDIGRSVLSLAGLCDETQVGKPFVVRLAGSGQELGVGADEAILDALLRAGLDIDQSCREGARGTCMATILDGVADHGDAILTPSERAANRCIPVCRSRALTPAVTLDLSLRVAAHSSGTPATGMGLEFL